MIHDHLIIGAGISGLYLGLELKKQNKNFLILEKSKGVGGRIATRRINEQGIDHGAPYLKSHPLLFDLIHDFNVQSGRIAVEGIYFEGGMTSLPKKMATELPIIKDEKIISFESSGGIWKCLSEKGNTFQAKNLIVTAPLPQALELLRMSKIDFSHHPELSSITYSKGLLGIFLTDEEMVINKSLPEEVHSVLAMKDRKLNPEGYVIRMSSEFAEKYFETSDDENLSRIEALLEKCFESRPVIAHKELKKWRYVAPMNVIQTPYLEINKNLFLIGDGFLFPDIRGALLSAKTLAKNLI